MVNGFIQLHRKIIDEWFWNNPKLAHLMVTLILEANHKSKEVSFDCKKRLVRRGETIRATRKLESLTGMSRSTISRLLKAHVKVRKLKLLQQKLKWTEFTGNTLVIFVRFFVFGMMLRFGEN